MDKVDFMVSNISCIPNTGSLCFYFTCLLISVCYFWTPRRMTNLDETWYVRSFHFKELFIGICWWDVREGFSLVLNILGISVLNAKSDHKQDKKYHQ